MIDLVESDDQAVLASAAADLLQKFSDSAERPWAPAAAQGWLGIGVPETLGGVGLGVAGQALLFREIGRSCSSLPVLESVLTITAALAARGLGEDLPGDLLRQLVEGERRVYLARVTGPGKLAVWEHQDPADLVLAVGEDEVALVDPRRLRLEPAADTIDPDYRLRRGTWDGEGAHVRGGPAVAGAVRVRGLVLTAALLSGIAAQVMDMSVRYAGQRVQYGRPIGAFQAVKHRCADMAVRSEAAWCMTALAAAEEEGETDQLGIDAGRADAYAAKLVAADAALRNARDNIQNHGATGFTAELTAHRYLKRAHVLDTMLATPAEVRSALIEEDLPW